MLPPPTNTLLSKIPIQTNVNTGTNQSHTPITTWLNYIRTQQNTSSHKTNMILSEMNLFRKNGNRLLPTLDLAAIRSIECWPKCKEGINGPDYQYCCVDQVVSNLNSSDVGYRLLSDAYLKILLDGIATRRDSYPLHAPVIACCILKVQQSIKNYLTGRNIRILDATERDFLAALSGIHQDILQLVVLYGMKYLVAALDDKTNTSRLFGRLSNAMKASIEPLQHSHRSHRQLDNLRVLQLGNNPVTFYMSTDNPYPYREEFESKHYTPEMTAPQTDPVTNYRLVPTSQPTPMGAPRTPTSFLPDPEISGSPPFVPQDDFLGEYTDPVETSGRTGIQQSFEIVRTLCDTPRMNPTPQLPLEQEGSCDNIQSAPLTPPNDLTSRNQTTHDTVRTEKSVDSSVQLIHCNPAPMPEPRIRLEESIPHIQKLLQLDTHPILPKFFVSKLGIDLFVLALKRSADTLFHPDLLRSNKPNLAAIRNLEMTDVPFGRTNEHMRIYAAIQNIFNSLMDKDEQRRKLAEGYAAYICKQLALHQRDSPLLMSVKLYNTIVLLRIFTDICNYKEMDSDNLKLVLPHLPMPLLHTIHHYGICFCGRCDEVKIKHTIRKDNLRLQKAILLAGQTIEFSAYQRHRGLNDDSLRCLSDVRSSFAGHPTPFSSMFFNSRNLPVLFEVEDLTTKQYEFGKVRQERSWSLTRQKTEQLMFSNTENGSGFVGERVRKFATSADELMLDYIFLDLLVEGLKSKDVKKVLQCCYTLDYLWEQFKSKGRVSQCALVFSSYFSEKLNDMCDQTRGDTGKTRAEVEKRTRIELYAMKNFARGKLLEASHLYKFPRQLDATFKERGIPGVLAKSNGLVWASSFYTFRRTIHDHMEVLGGTPRHERGFNDIENFLMTRTVWFGRSTTKVKSNVNNSNDNNGGKQSLETSSKRRKLNPTGPDNKNISRNTAPDLSTTSGKVSDDTGKRDR